MKATLAVVPAAFGCRVGDAPESPKDSTFVSSNISSRYSFVERSGLVDPPSSLGDSVFGAVVEVPEIDVVDGASDDLEAVVSLDPVLELLEVIFVVGGVGKDRARPGTSRPV